MSNDSKIRGLIVLSRKQVEFRNYIKIRVFFYEFRQSADENIYIE